jgi:protease secretion system outer membrane protein
VYIYIEAKEVEMMVRMKSATPILVAALFTPMPSYAIDLVGSFIAAKAVDPGYQAAKADKSATTSQAISGRLSYLPNYLYTRQQLPTLASPNLTQSITQPIFNATLAAQVGQGGPTMVLAGSTFQTRTNELAQKTLNAVNQIVLATEAIKANESQINSLESQYKGAQRKYDLGQGTVTDLLDVQVKFEQAKANDLTLKANLKGAKDQFFQITGQYPSHNDFILPNKHESFKVEPLEALLEKVDKQNPGIISARSTESISKYDIAKAAGAVLPTVSYVLQKTNYNSVQSNNNGISISIPIDANSYADNYTAYAKSQASSSNRLQTETQTKVEAQKLYALVEAGLESLKIKWKAMDTARLSVTANQKSYEAGVKSTTDVLIAIQTLYQTRNEYAQAATNQASNYMNLLLVAAENPDEVVQKTQLFLFRK